MKIAASSVTKVDEIFSRELDFEPFGEKILEFFLRLCVGESLKKIFLHKATSELILAKILVESKKNRLCRRFRGHFTKSMYVEFSDCRQKAPSKYNEIIIEKQSKKPACSYSETGFAYKLSCRHNCWRFFRSRFNFL